MAKYEGQSEVEHSEGPDALEHLVAQPGDVLYREL
jgi:hypothetical protein